jgi:hypothetical protein
MKGHLSRKHHRCPPNRGNPRSARRRCLEKQGDSALVKARARAHRWQRRLEGGRYRSLRELAAAYGVDRGHIARMLQLTLLAPDIVEAILNGTRPEAAGIPRSMEPFPLEWTEQRAALVLAFGPGADPRRTPAQSRTRSSVASACGATGPR